MANTAGGVVYEGQVHEDGPADTFVRWAARGGISDYMPIDGQLPNLGDPATLGCLLALVREAWGDETICVHRDGDYVWRAKTCMELRIRSAASTEPEALVAALETAP